MAPCPKPTSPLLLITTLLLLSAVISTTKPENLVAELLALQFQSKSGVIHLNDHSISRFLTSTKVPRPYSLLIFFDADQLRNKFQDIRGEFSLLASSFIINNADNSSASHAKLFFCKLELKESKSSFTLFGIKSLPHIRLVNPHVKSPKESDAMDTVEFSGIAEAMANFVQAKTKLIIGPIHRPPILSKNQVAFTIIVLLIWIPFMIKKIMFGQTMLQDPRIWLGGAVFVYFFSVSGLMFNIIRKMPMFMVDRHDHRKLMFFYEGSGVQFGAEGFSVGLLYTIVGILLAFVSHVLVTVKNVKVQRTIMIMSLVFSYPWIIGRLATKFIPFGLPRGSEGDCH